MDQARLHPILIVAGIAVLLFSLLGAAALTGVLSSATSRSGEAAAPVQKKQQPAARHEAPARAAQPAGCPSCGVIETIRAVEVQGDTSGLGAVAGGVAGAVVGNQFGRGDGRTVMTIAGAAGGAYAGNAIEKNVKKKTAYRVTVRLDDGSVRTLSQSAPPAFAVGERVRIVNGSLLERA
ncbi:MAG: glycine zipper 2TM domain-containing protein [Burkholderiales bacterium]